MIPAQLCLHLTSAIVTPPAEHAARRPAGEANAAATDVCVRESDPIMEE